MGPVTKPFTLNDCEQVIKANFPFNSPPVAAFKIKPYSNEVNGFLGEHLTVHINVRQNGKIVTKSYFAKQFPFQHALQSEYLLENHGFRREAAIFSVLLPNYAKYVPNYSVNFVPHFFYNKSNELLVFEDLRATGYKIANKPSLNLLDLEHIQLTLKALAEFHAGSLLYEHYKGLELGRPFSIEEEMKEFLIEPLITENYTMARDFCYASLKGLTALVDLIPNLKLEPEEFKRKLDELLKRSFEIMKERKKFKSVVCHGDMWAKNVLYKYDNNVPLHCKLVDFQLIRYFPPAHDVLLFLYITTSAEMRQHHFHWLLKYYHNCLGAVVRKSGVDIEHLLSYEEFKLSVAFILPEIKLQHAIQLSVQAGSPRFLKDLLQKDEDFKKFIFADRAPFAVELFKNDDRFKYLLSKSLKECEEIILYPRISREDCYEIINKKLGTTFYDLISFKLIPCSDLAGFLGDYFKLNIKIRYQWKEHEFNLFVKCNPVEKQTSVLVNDLDGFFKEIFFYDTYKQLVSNVGVDLLDECAANCYLTRQDDKMVFDDLVAQKFKQINQVESLEYSTLKVTLKKLAKFHACSIILEERMSEVRGGEYRINEEFPLETANLFWIKDTSKQGAKLCATGLNAVYYIVDLFPDLVKDPKSFLERYDKLKEETFSIIQTSTKYRNVLCHSDLWTTNLLFKFDDENRAVDCRFVDFQVVRYIPPANDVLALLHLTTDQNLRKNHMNELIDFYYAELKDNLALNDCDINKIYSYEQFWESVEYIRPQLVVQNLMYQQLSRCTPEELSTILHSKKKCEEILFGSRREYIFEMYQKNERYRNYLTEVFQDLVEECDKEIWHVKH